MPPHTAAVIQITSPSWPHVTPPSGWSDMPTMCVRRARQASPARKTTQGFSSCRCGHLRRRLRGGGALSQAHASPNQATAVKLLFVA